ncbi:hypothetical protein HMF8227_02404 [Saliniradius amylolyticus]|uniref:Outer membrane protein beta-barrel domain-containing protein n=1 Tax=Saliniradius amylolyticus TaxID=2183582 RepID=A0A2S2E5C2_9ALTE|nr:outer membrane beta-barrel protein [Saliniradius amylolyticus]AWL12856.1 hypothetical protein HMF8227_02404 [Saliniradius amylolyticus]
MKLQTLAMALAVGWTGLASAASNGTMYGLAAASYNDADAGQAAEKGMGYGIAFGYEFHRQWYVEAGYQQLLDEPAENVLTIADTSAELPQGVEAGGAFVALLGKASSTHGTLFYRLGVMALDHQSSYYASVDDGCAEGADSGVSVQTLTQCMVDDTSAAGLAGLGFDFYLTPNWSLRTEYQYVRGEDDFESHGGLIGVKYHF